MPSRAEKQRRKQLLAGTEFRRGTTPSREATAAAARDHIERHPHPAWVTFGSGVREDIIQKAEERLGLRFSPSYRWWLRHYGAGTVGGFELNRLAEEFYTEPDDGTCFAGEIVQQAGWDAVNGRTDARERLVLLSVLGDPVYYFDTRHPDDRGEYQIYCDRSGSEVELFARNFYEFLLKII